MIWWPFKGFDLKAIPPKMLKPLASLKISPNLPKIPN